MMNDMWMKTPTLTNDKWQMTWRFQTWDQGGEKSLGYVERSGFDSFQNIYYSQEQNESREKTF